MPKGKQCSETMCRMAKLWHYVDSQTRYWCEKFKSSAPHHPVTENELKCMQYKTRENMTTRQWCPIGMENDSINGCQETCMPNSQEITQHVPSERVPRSPASSLVAHSTTWSTVKPKCSPQTAPGAEAPKQLMPTHPSANSSHE